VSVFVVGLVLRCVDLLCCMIGWMVILILLCFLRWVIIVCLMILCDWLILWRMC